MRPRRCSCAPDARGRRRQGDSGGPLVALAPGGDQWAYSAVIGVTSFGPMCGSGPGVYTRVSAFAPWIVARVPYLAASPPAATSAAVSLPPPPPAGTMLNCLPPSSSLCCPFLHTHLCSAHASRLLSRIALCSRAHVPLATPPFQARRFARASARRAAWCAPLTPPRRSAACSQSSRQPAPAGPRSATPRAGGSLPTLGTVPGAPHCVNCCAAPFAATESARDAAARSQRRALCLRA